MVGGTSKETNWTAAFAAAEKHPEGELVNVHGQTLRGMEKTGAAYRRDGKWYMQGKGPGPMEEPKIGEDAPAKVSYTVQDSAMWQLHLDVTGAPDTSHPDHPGAALRPVGVSLGIGATDGVWSVSAVNVFGQKVKDGKVVTKRNYPLPFLDPLGEDSEAPEWLRKVCQDWVDKANGVGGGVSLTDKQVYDLNNRLHSNLGLRPTREVLEDVLGTTAEAAPVREPVKGVSPQRSQFDSALRVLLMRENLDGTEWAIRQLREGSDAARVVAEESTELRLDKDLMWMTLGLAADELEKLLDKRAAELATKGN
jgi:hypothetical protein